MRQCSGPTPNGGTYTKAGPQQIDGQTLTCNGGGSCDMSPEMSISASTSLMNEVSTTETNSVGMSISVSAGFMILDGPMGSVTTSSSVDFSEAVAKAMSTENSNTVTKSLSLSIGLEPGANFNRESYTFVYIAGRLANDVYSLVHTNAQLPVI